MATLKEKSRGKALTLLDASEVQLDGAATLVLTFSIPLKPDQDFSRSVHLVDKKSGKVDGAWELAPNLKELRLRHLEPKRELIVTVDPTLIALNDATLGSPLKNHRHSRYRAECRFRQPRLAAAGESGRRAAGDGAERRQCRCQFLPY